MPIRPYDVFEDQSGADGKPEKAEEPAFAVPIVRTKKAKARKNQFFFANRLALTKSLVTIMPVGAYLSVFAGRSAQHGELN